jgi:hypothetical protein
MLAKVRGIGIVTANMLVNEVLALNLYDRRRLFDMPAWRDPRVQAKGEGLWTTFSIASLTSSHASPPISPSPTWNVRERYGLSSRLFCLYETYHFHNLNFNTNFVSYADHYRL